MPMVLAASTMRGLAGTVSFLPSIVRLTSGMSRDRPDVALVPQRVVLVLLAEVAEGRVDDPSAGVTETAEAAAVLQAVRDPLEGIELQLRAFIGQDSFVGSHRPVLADPARGALATGLVGVELQEAMGRLDDAVRVVHHDHAARAGHRPR